jgi:hypothetical protein
VLAWRNNKGNIVGKKVTAERTHLSCILSKKIYDLLDYIGIIVSFSICKRFRDYQRRKNTYESLILP